MTGDQEEPSLPAYPPGAEYDSVSHQFMAPNKRKRSTDTCLFSDSSERPLFSSDNDPAAENYVQGRRKRQYVGPWDNLKPVTQAAGGKVKRKLERQNDSGIYMGSDTSFDSVLDDDFSIPPAPSRLPGHQLIQVPRPSQTTLPAREAEALRVIQSCVDTGCETVDLSRLQLDHISSATVSRISEIAPFPNVQADVPFAQQDPELKLYLSNNSLTRVPGALFNLEHLTVLSLRRNQLTEVPPAICKLKHLRELNLSQNCIKCLPFELLDLVKDESCPLSTLVVHPNPFYQPVDLHNNLYPGADVISARPQAGNLPKGSFRGRTPVQVSSTRGTLLSKFCITPSQTYLETESIEVATVFKENSQTKVFSLTEIVLQSCARSMTDPAWWRDPWLAETLPNYPHLAELLDEMHEQREAGGLQCTACGRQVIKPVAQWIEWHELFVESLHPTQMSMLTKTQENLVPFVRRACSWKCVRDSLASSTAG